jgi:sporadic carbohydrate cluster protein (TIGR04323 family)
MLTRKGFRGYCTHNAFGEYRMPVPAQNILYRDYANKNGLYFKLSVNELFFKKCFLHLFALLDELEWLEGILMCSIFMLPQDKGIRQKIYERLLESDCELHFVLENFILKNINNVEELEQIFQLRKMTENCTEINQLAKMDYEN